MEKSRLRNKKLNQQRDQSRSRSLTRVRDSKKRLEEVVSMILPRQEVVGWRDFVVITLSSLDVKQELLFITIE